MTIKYKTVSNPMEGVYDVTSDFAILESSWKESVVDYYVSETLKGAPLSGIVDQFNVPDIPKQILMKELIEDKTRENIELIIDIIKTYCEVYIAHHLNVWHNQDLDSFGNLSSIVTSNSTDE